MELSPVKEKNMHHMRSEAGAIREQLSTWRETLHRHPELSLKEFWTTDYLKKELAAMGVEIVDWGGETGVVGLLRGARPGKCVALRADIDALPIEEKSGVPFASENPGVMHACGHDSHMAALLGAARLLAARKNDLAGTVKFIFQPAEEIFTGGPLMVKKGVLENPHVDFIFGQHNICEYPAGKGLVSPGPIMACTAFISITVHGKGGHGAVPHLAHDPVVAAAAIVSSLQTVVSREMRPTEAVVVTIGSIHGGTVANVIPDTVTMQGTVRCFDLELFHELGDRLRRIIDHTAAAYNVKADFDYNELVPNVNTPPELVQWLRNGPMKEVYGAENILPCTPSMGGEDFACYMAQTPGVFVWFGSGNPEKGIRFSWHNPAFNVDDESLICGAALYAQVALDWLAETAG